MRPFKDKAVKATSQLPRNLARTLKAFKNSQTARTTVKSEENCEEALVKSAACAEANALLPSQSPD